MCSRSLKMVFLVLFAGALLVAVIITFISFGIIHPVPWLLVACLLAIPVLVNKCEKKHFAVWKDEYSVGIQSLDDDHRKLLHLINNLQTAVRYQTGEIFEKEALTEVVAYTKYHFEREEKMMKEIDYENFEAHKKTHETMIEKTNSFVQEYDKRGHEVIEEVALYLKNWLLGHINGTDQEYSTLMKQRGLS